MKKRIGRCFAILLIALLAACTNKQDEMLSPDGKISVELANDSAQHLTYVVKREGKIIVEPSVLGLLRDDADFATLSIVKISEKRKVNDSYITPAGKKYKNTVDANQWDVDVVNEKGMSMCITFHLANNGVAFRYAFNETSDNPKTIRKEHTSFRFATTAKAWMHPHDDVKNCWAQTCPSYEDNYMIDIAVGTKAPKAAGWSFPALYQTENTWVMLTEAGLEPAYCGSRLAQECEGGEYFIAFPQGGESLKPTDQVLPVAKLPLQSPWRIIMLGDMNAIIANTMVTDLSEPSRVANTNFVKPGIASWSWGVEKDNSVTYQRQKEYIDYAASMSWEYTLVDALWDTVIGYEKIQELADYGKTKNVKLLLWYNSAGDWNTTYQTPKNMLVDKETRRKEFERIHKMGIAGIKVDFWPGDGPKVVQYYYDLLQDAAEFELLVNFHGTTIPRGWSRTFPNLMTMEAIKGFEFITFAQETADLAPQHCVMAVFARNVVGAMDFTPVCFGEVPGVQRRTSNAFELALSILFQSGIQHIVEIPESMTKQPDYVQQFMRTIPRVWDDVKLIDGFPAKYVVLARKAGDKWYIAGINSEPGVNKMELNLTDLGITTAGNLITDGDSLRSFSQKDVTIVDGKLTVEMQPNGGFVAVF